MSTSTSTSLSEFLEPIAAWFNSLGTPEPIVHWGHPVMMGIVVLVLGSYVAYAGWQGRVATDEAIATKNKADHRKLAPLMSLFIALGFTGGVLSLVMQGQPILSSPHFWTGTGVLLLLAINGTLSVLFSKDRPALRTAHAYLGLTVMAVLLVHGVLGLKLGLSI